VTDRDGLIIAPRPDGANRIGKPILPERVALRTARDGEARITEDIAGRTRVIATAMSDGRLPRCASWSDA
jgi:hypothetical protein